MAPPRQPVNTWRAYVQVVTVAKFERPKAPRTCQPKLYHVWRWQAPLADPNDTPPYGTKCQCGRLEWEPPK